MRVEMSRWLWLGADKEVMRETGVICEWDGGGRNADGDVNGDEGQVDLDECIDDDDGDLYTGCFF